MPIRVLHTAPAAAAGIAQNVGQFAGDRQLVAEQQRQQSVNLQQAQFGADVGYRRAQLQQQAQRQQMELRLAQDRLREQQNYHQGALQNQLDVARLNQQGQLQRAAVSGDYGLQRVGMQQQGQDERLIRREQGLDDRQLQKLAADAQQEDDVQQFKAWMLERGHELKRGQQEDTQQHMERLARLRNDWALDRQARTFGQQDKSREDSQVHQQNIADQRAGAASQNRAAAVRQQLQSNVNTAQRLLLDAQRNFKTQDQVPALEEQLKKAREALRLYEDTSGAGPPGAPGMVPVPMVPQVPPVPGVGYGGAPGPQAGQVVRLLDGTLLMPDGTRMREVGIDPATGEPLVVPVQ